MFCAECGSEVSDGLRFCNRCGASLGTQAPPRLLAMIVFLSLSFAVVTVAGLLFVLVLATEYMSRRDAAAVTYLFIALMTLTVFVLGALMVRQISRLLTVYLQSSEPKTARTEKRTISKTSAPELTPPPAAETLPLHITDRDTEKMPADTDEQELPTRKL